MKTNMKKITAVIMVFLMIALAGCGSKYGVIKEGTNVDGTQKAYLFTRKADAGTEYCLTLLNADEKLDTNAEPNIYKSYLEFDFEYEEGMLSVGLNEEDETIKDPMEIGTTFVVFGEMIEVAEEE